MVCVKIVQVRYVQDVDEKMPAGVYPTPIYPECPYFTSDKYDEDVCTHPKEGHWRRCSTNHMKPIDERSCPFDIHAELIRDA